MIVRKLGFTVTPAPTVTLRIVNSHKTGIKGMSIIFMRHQWVRGTKTHLLVNYMAHIIVISNTDQIYIGYLSRNNSDEIL